MHALSDHPDPTLAGWPPFQSQIDWLIGLLGWDYNRMINDVNQGLNRRLCWWITGWVWQCLDYDRIEEILNAYLNLRGEEKIPVYDPDSPTLERDVLIPVAKKNGLVSGGKLTDSGFVKGVLQELYTWSLQPGNSIRFLDPVAWKDSQAARGNPPGAGPDAELADTLALIRNILIAGAVLYGGYIAYPFIRQWAIRK